MYDRRLDHSFDLMLPNPITTGIGKNINQVYSQILINQPHNVSQSDSLGYLVVKGRKAEEQRSQRLTAEFSQFRHEAERRLQEKEEEIEAIR